MKKLMLSVLGAAALALGGCGTSPSQETSQTRPDFPESVQGPRYELRLKGVNNPGYGSALVQVRGVSVTTPEGQPVPVRLKARQAMDLTQEDQAWLVGVFVVPPGVERVNVQVMFDDFGGYEDGSGAGVIDTRVAPLRFQALTEDLERRGRAVVQLALGPSLRAQGEERLLLPALDVRY